MPIEQSRTRELVSRPGEALNVEIKRWFDPQQDAGIATIVKAAFALRNRNGGYLVLGFDDKTLKPDNTNRPFDIRAAFHLDQVQGIISRYASVPFEIEVAFEQHDGNEHAIIVIPEGVITPVAVKRDLVTSPGGKTLLGVGEVYFRTLNTNGTPSTARARPEDWPDIMQICFDNRKADIGRFLRRQLSGPGLTTVLEMLGGAQAPPPPTLRDRADALLVDGQQRFEHILAKRSLTPEQQPLSDAASWSIALVVDPKRSDVVADHTFLAAVASSNPKFSAWPPWLDARFLVDEAARPIVIDNGWEALIISPLAGWSNHLDFWRLDPEGKFFLQRMLQDDTVPQRVRPGLLLDPTLAVLRVAEVIAVGLSVTRELGWDAKTAQLGFAFRWTKLNGRRLDPWAYPLETAFIGGGTAHDDQVETFVELPLDTPSSAIAPFVDEATRRLVALFDGYRMAPEEIERWVHQLLERSLR